MYCKHFGFEESPFGVTSDPQFFYSNIANEEILAALAREIERGNALVVVTGEAGTGKTTLLRRLIGGLPGTINCAFIIVNARLSFIALLRRILKEVGVSNTSTDRESLLEQLNNYVQEQFTKDRSVALLFDEAQAMSDEVLKEIPSLCDSDSKKLMSIVLMGQPDLERRLGHSNLRSLKQQITLTRRLTPLKQNDDVGPYITSKLEQAGFKGDELFEPAAIERIISWSSGIPRLINTICDNALLLAYQASECTVTAGMIDEVANHLRLVECPPRAHQKKIDEAGDQPRFDDQPPVEDQSEIDEVASQLRLDDRLPIEEQRKIDEAINQPRFIDHSPVADQKRVDEVGDQPHFDDQPPVENQIEIDEVASQLRLDDRLPIEDQEKIDEVGDQPLFVDRSPIAEEIDAVANQPRFDDQPPVEDQREIDEVANQLHLVDDRSAGSDQKPMLEIEQTQKLDIAFPMESVEAGSIIDDNAGEVSDQLIPPIYQARTVGQRNYQLSNVNRLRISIGALMILVVVAGGLAVFYPRQRQAVVPGINKYVENSRAEVNTVAAPAKPTQVDTNPVAEEGPQLASNSPPPSPVIQQDRGQKDARTAKKQNLVEVANVDKLVRPVSQQIYRVSGPSFLRNRPTANAEIVDTLQPGIRIAIISRSGEYFRVRSLGDANVFGFVHKEDAFFERIQ